MRFVGGSGYLWNSGQFVLREHAKGCAQDTFSMPLGVMWTVWGILLFSSTMCWLGRGTVQAFISQQQKWEDDTWLRLENHRK